MKDYYKVLRFIYIPIFKWKYRYELRNLKKKILAYYKKNPPVPTDIERIEALSFLKRNPISYFPYNFSTQYQTTDFDVIYDSDKQMYYVLHEGDYKLYFKKKYTEQKIRQSYNSLRIEQDIQSPHRYITSEFYISEGEIVADVGSAEGIFSIHALLHNASKVYIFEPDEEWIEPLQATFEPWKNKVEIIQKFVSDHNDEQHTTLDNFFLNKEIPNVIKMDVEGMERFVFSGAKKLLANSPQKIVVCTYHKDGDSEKFTEFLSGNGYKTFISSNYMLVFEDKLRAPFFRRGLIYGTKE